MQISYNVTDHNFDPLFIRHSAYMKNHSRQDTVNVLKKHRKIDTEKVSNNKEEVKKYRKHKVSNNKNKKSQ